jgi:predicted DNA-binding protein
MSRWRTGNYQELLEARISPREYRQLEKIAEILGMTKASLVRYFIENAVEQKYGVKK